MLSQRPRTVYEERPYEASLGELIAVLSEISDDVNDLMLIGHNPCTHALADALAGRLEHERLRRAKSHGNHGEVIGHRAIRDHMALRPLPATPYLVTQRHLRYVGKDCLVAFDANLYSVPARKVRPRQLVEVRATKSQITLHSTVPDANGDTLLAIHPRAVGRGACIVDEKHWDGLPTAGTDGPPPVTPLRSPAIRTPSARRRPTR